MVPVLLVYRRGCNIGLHLSFYQWFSIWHQASPWLHLKVTQIGGESWVCLLQLRVGVHHPCPPLQEQGISSTP